MEGSERQGIGGEREKKVEESRSERERCEVTRSREERGSGEDEGEKNKQG